MTPYIHSMDAGVQTGVFPDGSPIGKVASEIASNNGIQIGSLPHPEFGSVRLYPYNVISEAFRVSGQVNN